MLNLIRRSAGTKTALVTIVMSVAVAKLERAEVLLGLQEGPWYENVLGSEPARWVIFILGVWLGAYAAQ